MVLTTLMMHLIKFFHILPLAATAVGAGHLRRDGDVQLDGQYTKQYIVEVESVSIVHSDEPESD